MQQAWLFALRRIWEENERKQDKENNVWPGISAEPESLDREEGKRVSTNEDNMVSCRPLTDGDQLDSWNWSIKSGDQLNAESKPEYIQVETLHDRPLQDLM